MTDKITAISKEADSLAAKAQKIYDENKEMFKQ
jgi:hypothetical protein